MTRGRQKTGYKYEHIWQFRWHIQG
jgi:hypothetical protein